ALTDPANKQLAYEKAVCICDADGVASEAEQQFLMQLRTTLGLAARQTSQLDSEAAALAEAPLPNTPVDLPINTASSAATAQPTGSAVRQATMSDAELDKYILNHAIV